MGHFRRHWWNVALILRAGNISFEPPGGARKKPSHHLGELSSIIPARFFSSRRTTSIRKFELKSPPALLSAFHLSVTKATRKDLWIFAGKKKHICFFTAMLPEGTACMNFWMHFFWRLHCNLKRLARPSLQPWLCSPSFPFLSFELSSSSCEHLCLQLSGSISFALAI